MAKSRKALAVERTARAHDDHGDSAVGDSTAGAHQDSTTTARESTHSEAARDWLTRFPIQSRSRVGLWFNITARDAHGALNPAVLMQRVHLKLARHIQDGREPQYTDACLVLQALEDDPEGTLAYAKAVIAYQKLPPTERARLKAVKGAQYRRAAMAAKLSSAVQSASLRRRGGV